MVPVADRWMKYFWIRFKKSPAVMRMKDYQRFWYHSLLCESIYSERPGYLPNDIAVLFVLSGCTARRQFFDRNWGCVREQFRESEDRKWLFHPKALEIAQRCTDSKSSTVSTDSTGEEVQKPEKQLDIPSLFSSLEINPSDHYEEAVERLFNYYRSLFEKDGRYRLTDQRKKKCIHRLYEFRQANKCSLEAAEEAAQEAMCRLRASEFHWENGHYDWIDHLFKSQEEFEKRLAMRARPTELRGSQIGVAREQSPEEIKANAEDCERKALEILQGDYSEQLKGWARKALEQLRSPKEEAC